MTTQETAAAREPSTQPVWVREMRVTRPDRTFWSRLTCRAERRCDVGLLDGQVTFDPSQLVACLGGWLGRGSGEVVQALACELFDEFG